MKCPPCNTEEGDIMCWAGMAGFHQRSTQRRVHQRQHSKCAPKHVRAALQRAHCLPWKCQAVIDISCRELYHCSMLSGFSCDLALHWPLLAQFFVPTAENSWPGFQRGDSCFEPLSFPVLWLLQHQLHIFSSAFCKTFCCCYDQLNFYIFSV